MNSKSLVAHHLIIIVLGICLGIIPFLQSGWLPTSPDSAGLACGAQYIADTGEFATSRFRGFNFHYNPCWTIKTYPGNQMFTAIVIQATGLPGYNVVVGLSMITYITCAVLIYWIMRIITKQPTVALWSGLSAVSSLVLARALLLTPQNLYGYVFILVGLFGVALWERTHRWPYWLLVAGSIVLLSVFHTLSLAVLGIALCIFIFITFYRSPRILAMLAFSLLVISSVIGKILLGSWNPLTLLSNAVHFSIPGITNPWYDHPAVWGYTATALAILGFSEMLRQKKINHTLLLSLCIGIVSVIFSHPKLTGIEILPERVIAYAWIPITLLAGIGIQQLIDWGKSWYRYVLPVLVIISMCVHFIIFTEDSYVGISKRFIPDTDFITAMKWLEKNRQTNTFLVGVGNIINRQITYSGLWYSGDSMWYPWYRLNHKNITDFASTDTTYQPIVESPSHPDHQSLKDLYTFVTLPQSNSAKKIATTYGITHFLAWKRGPEYTIWNEDTLFQIVYENNQYVIYEIE